MMLAWLLIVVELMVPAVLSDIAQLGKRVNVYRSYCWFVFYRTFK